VGEAAMKIVLAFLAALSFSVVARAEEPSAPVEIIGFLHRIGYTIQIFQMKTISY